MREDKSSQPWSRSLMRHGCTSILMTQQPLLKCIQTANGFPHFISFHDRPASGQCQRLVIRFPCFLTRHLLVRAIFGTCSSNCSQNADLFRLHMYIMKTTSASKNRIKQNIQNEMKIHHFQFGMIFYFKSHTQT